MKIIIAGAYAIGTHLARLLSRSNEEITLIDESEERLASIGSDCDLLTMLPVFTSYAMRGLQMPTSSSPLLR